MTIVPFKPGFAARSKYKNVRTLHDGVSFASKREATRYAELKLMERAGEISDLKLQVRFKLVVNSEPVCAYVADFVFTDKAGRTVVQDAKGFETDVFRIKRALMKACLGIEVQTV